MAIQFNSSPYFDDFDPAKNFYKVLFKPGYAVQARELNQLQSILQNQISAVGNHIFKKNAIVIPGGISFNTSTDLISIIGVGDPSTLVGKTITNASSFDVTDDSTLDGYTTAIVLGSRAATTTEPAALYIKYLKTQADRQTVGNRATFNISEALKTVDTDLISFAVDSTIGATVGKVATISSGTFYTKETFVDVAQQSAIIEIDNATVTNCTIGLKIVESIVSSDQDESLLDNATGSPNQYAPGADRYKIELVLTKLDPSQVADEDTFIRMMTIENNVVTFLNNKTGYAELMTMLARRTYDANGNFVVRGLETSITQSNDDSHLYANVASGKCYLGGYEYEQLATTPIAIEKPRAAAYQKEVGPVVTYSAGMTYFYTAGGSYLTELPVEDSLVQFVDSNEGTNVIGYGIFKDIQFYSGTIGTSDVYKVFFDYIGLEKGYSISDIGGMKVITSNEGAPILHELRITNATGTFAAGNTIENATDSSQSGLIFSVLNNSVFVIKNSSDPVPAGDTVKDTTTNATASLASSFITNYTQSNYPMIQIDSDVIKTLYRGGSNTTSYSVVRRDQFTITTSGTLISDSLTGDDVFEDFSSSDYFGFITNSGSEEFVDLTGILSLTSFGKQYQIVIAPGSPLIDKTLWVYSTVNKINVIEADKTPTTIAPSITIRTPSSSWMALGHQDIVELKKVVDGKTVGITSAAWSTNVATITVPTGHGINVSDIVVVSNITSSNNTTGAFNSGYNGQFTVTGKTDTEFTYALTSNPGTTASTTNAIVALPPDINSDKDITSRFVLQTGNTPYLTGTGAIKLIKGATPPQGQIAVRYVYNVVGSGNYISVDSYGSYTNPDLSYIGQIPGVVVNDNTILETRSYLDFRTRPSAYFFKNIGTIRGGTATLTLRDLNLSTHSATLVGKYVVGPGHLGGATITAVSFDKTSGNTVLTLNSNASGTAPIIGTYYVGLNGSSLSLIDTGAGAKSFEYPKDSSRFTYEYVKFLPRQIMVYVNRDNDLLKIDYQDVSSRVEVFNYARNEFKLPLAYVYMKPYTVSIRDVALEKFENPVYQMIDIHNIKRQVDRAEYYALQAVSRDIESEVRLAGSETLTTASRGLWSETFSDVANQDYFNDDFACTIYDKSYVAPGTVTRTIPLDVASSLYSATWQQTGSAITLPYTESRAFGNTSASRSNNLNPFNVVDWSGKLVLNPSVDNWVDTTNVPTASVNNTATIVTDIATSSVVTVAAPAPVVAPPPIVATLPPSIVPPIHINEIVTEVSNLRAAWGRDSAGGYHAITFDWVTSTGRRGRVNTDIHLSSAVNARGTNGYNGVFAKSLINRSYSDTDVREYLNAGTHFDQRPPSAW